MNIVLNRIDEWLIHGQVLASWAKKLKAQQILVVDEQLVDDQFAETVLTMAIPEGMGMKSLDTVQASEYLREHADGTPPNTILLVKRPETLWKLRELGYHPGQINIGGMAAGPSRKYLSRNLYASEKEIEMLKSFQEEGIPVYAQIVFGDSKKDFGELF